MVSETANGFKCLKMHSNAYFPKRAKNTKNGKKWPEIAHNCKISEITKYGEQITQIDKNVKKCRKLVKNGHKMAKFKKTKCHRCSGLKLPQQITVS